MNQGNADKGGGDNKPTDGPGELQPTDPRTQNLTGPANDNNHGHSDPATVVPETPAVVPASGSANPPVVVPQGGENKMTYEPDPVTERGPVQPTPTPAAPTPAPIQPTAESGDGAFTPAD